MTGKTEIAETPQGAAVIEIPLSKLKKSLKNARKTPHSEAAIEALAASITAKGLLQAPVVEPELDGEGRPTGCYLVTIGEGRRLALLLRAKRKEIKKSEPVLCVVDVTNDPHEISLDENVTRSEMHPADQFEAFKRLSDERGLSAEDIGARFGVSAQVVRQRLRLGAVSPRLMQVYRDGGLNLDQLMAFAVSEDHARQEQVFDSLSWNRNPHAIRRSMTETHVPATDRRAMFIGAESYRDAGGTILRDLFTEDGGGWFEDPGLLDRLVLEKLEGIAADVREGEGWKWATAHADYPHGHGFGRAYPHKAPRTPEQGAEIEAISAEYDALTHEWAAVEDLPSEVEARLSEIDRLLQAYGDDHVYDPEDLARGGVFVVLGYDGTARIERGLIRPEDQANGTHDIEAGEEGVSQKDDQGESDAAAEREAGEGEADEAAPLSDRLVLGLTAHRTAALRDAVAENPDAALLVAVHAAALRAYYPGAGASCATISLTSRDLGRDAEGIEDSLAQRKIGERHAAWARQLPAEAAELWTFIVGLDADSRLSLFAHAVSLTIDVVRSWQARPVALAHGEALAAFVGLDLTAYWAPTARSYFYHVTKARIADAVREAVSDEAAERIGGMKRAEMATAAEALVAGTGWLPPILRTAKPAEPAASDESPLSFAAE